MWSQTCRSFPSNVLLSQKIVPPWGPKLEIRIQFSHSPSTYVSHSIYHQVLSFLPLKSIHFPSQGCCCSSCHYSAPHRSPYIFVAPQGGVYLLLPLLKILNSSQKENRPLLVPVYFQLHFLTSSLSTPCLTLLLSPYSMAYFSPVFAHVIPSLTFFSSSLFH